MSEETKTDEAAVAATETPEAATEEVVEQAEKGRGNRKTLVGVVVSDKMSKTRVVEVQRLELHRRYKKYVRRDTKYHVHDEEETSKVGDKVLIQETRPLSRTKRWRLVKVMS